MKDKKEVLVFCPKCNKLQPVKVEFNCEDNHYSEISYDHTGICVLFCSKCDEHLGEFNEFEDD
jgi:hypothetical protein